MQVTVDVFGSDGKHDSGNNQIPYGGQREHSYFKSIPYSEFCILRLIGYSVDRINRMRKPFGRIQ